MAAAFGVGETFLDKELSRFIAAGRLNAKIDKVSQFSDVTPDGSMRVCVFFYGLSFFSAGGEGNGCIHPSVFPPALRLLFSLAILLDVGGGFCSLLDWLADSLSRLLRLFCFVSFHAGCFSLQYIYRSIFFVFVRFIHSFLHSFIHSFQVGGVVETNRPDTKNAQYQACIKQGDLLLNRVQKLGRVVDA